MASYSIAAKKGDHAKDYLVAAGQTAITADNIVLTFDTSGTGAGLRKADLQQFAIELQKRIAVMKFPPV
jgi:hypothetical protein